MKNKSPQTHDFFARYHRARMFQYFLPGFFGIFIAFGLVSVSHTSDMRGLMASVSQVAIPNYDADIVLERHGNNLNLVLGKNMQRVDTINIRLLSNPADNVRFNSEQGTITDETEGAYFFVRSYAGKDIAAGTVLATFSDIPASARIALTDTEFVSEGVRYSLTSKGE